MNANASRNRRTLSQGFNATFGRVEAPRFGRKTLIAVGLAGLFTAGVASADWRVYDDNVEGVLKDIRTYIGENSPRSVNQNLDEIYKQGKVKGEIYDPQVDDETKSKPMTDDDASAISSVDKAKGRRCGAKKLPAAQKTICEQIVDMEQARYTYLLDMRKLSQKREEQLKQITDERGQIGEDEPGKLQSNTNRLLALMTHQRIDHLNLQMAMNVFDERLRDKREQLHYQGGVAMNPRNKTEDSGGLGGGFDWGSLFDGATQVATLEAALQVARERER